MSLFNHIRQLAATRWLRVVAVVALMMCTVTWVAQTVSAVDDGDLAVALAAADQADGRQAALDVDCGGEDVDCDAIPLVALDETHDVKLFFLREFTHLLQPVVARMPRNRDLAAILRMSSETFRPPDQQIGRTGRVFTF